MADKKCELATFGAGCFWGVEEAFKNIPGVLSTAVGYAGGVTDDPSYEQVCSGKTGHAEVVHLEFDPEQVSFESLLEAFWNLHDPTTPNRQGPDIGSQYRSIVLYHSPDQKIAASAAKKELEENGRYASPVVTEIEPFTIFYRAEEYHQRYLEKRGRSSCSS